MKVPKHFFSWIFLFILWRFTVSDAFLIFCTVFLYFFQKNPISAKISLFIKTDSQISVTAPKFSAPWLRALFDRIFSQKKYRKMREDEIEKLANFIKLAETGFIAPIYFLQGSVGRVSAFFSDFFFALNFMMNFLLFWVKIRDFFKPKWLKLLVVLFKM